MCDGFAAGCPYGFVLEVYNSRESGLVSCQIYIASRQLYALVLHKTGKYGLGADGWRSGGRLIRIPPPEVWAAGSSEFVWQVFPGISVQAVIFAHGAPCTF